MLSNLKLYIAIHPLIKIIMEYIREHDLFGLPSGKTEIMGNDLYVLRETYHIQKASECIFEGHLNLWRCSIGHIRVQNPLDIVIKKMKTIKSLILI
jgi:hypothetical protein